MARFVTTGLDDLIRDMQKMGQDSGKVAESMVDAAAEVIRGEWKASAEGHDLIDTGAMINSIGTPGPVKRIGGIFSQTISPQGKDSKGVRNAEKAFILNYGTSRIPATYWVDEAETAAGPKVQKRLEDIWDEFLKTGKVPAVNDSTGSTGEGVTKYVTKG